jgi:hypothetical protein
VVPANDWVDRTRRYRAAAVQHDVLHILGETLRRDLGRLPVLTFEVVHRQVQATT